jgi:hypothetical protein
MLEDILDHSEEFSDCRDPRIENAVCHINLIKLNSYDCRLIKKSLILAVFLLGINS